MRCCSNGGVTGLDTGLRKIRRGSCKPFTTSERCNKILRNRSRRQAESVSGKTSSSRNEDKPDKDTWVAKFFEGSDEDEPQWERESEPVSIKDKVIDVLDREKERSKFWGRLAVLALGAVLLSERISGKGIVTALNMATGVPIFEIEPVLGLVVLAILAVGILPAFRKSNNPDAEKPSTLDSFQVVTGRVACVLLAGTILAEALTGKGILALLNINTGVEITEIEGGLTFVLLLLFTADTAKEKENSPK